MQNAELWGHLRAKSRLRRLRSETRLRAQRAVTKRIARRYPVYRFKYAPGVVPVARWNSLQK